MLHISSMLIHVQNRCKHLRQNYDTGLLLSEKIMSYSFKRGRLTFFLFTYSIFSTNFLVIFPKERICSVLRTNSQFSHINWYFCVHLRNKTYILLACTFNYFERHGSHKKYVTLDAGANFYFSNIFTWIIDGTLPWDGLGCWVTSGCGKVGGLFCHP